MHVPFPVWVNEAELRAAWLRALAEDKDSSFTKPSECIYSHSGAAASKPLVLFPLCKAESATKDLRDCPWLWA